MLSCRTFLRSEDRGLSKRGCHSRGSRGIGIIAVREPDLSSRGSDIVEEFGAEGAQEFGFKQDTMDLSQAEHSEELNIEMRSSKVDSQLFEMMIFGPDVSFKQKKLNSFERRTSSGASLAVSAATHSVSRAVSTGLALKHLFDMDGSLFWWRFFLSQMSDVFLQFVQLLNYSGIRLIPYAIIPFVADPRTIYTQVGLISMDLLLAPVLTYFDLRTAALFLEVSVDIGYVLNQGVRPKEGVLEVLASVTPMILASNDLNSIGIRLITAPSVNAEERKAGPPIGRKLLMFLAWPLAWVSAAGLLGYTLSKLGPNRDFGCVNADGSWLGRIPTAHLVCVDKIHPIFDEYPCDCSMVVVKLQANSDMTTNQCLPIQPYYLAFPRAQFMFFTASLNADCLLDRSEMPNFVAAFPFLKYLDAKAGLQDVGVKNLLGLHRLQVLILSHANQSDPWVPKELSQFSDLEMVALPSSNKSYVHPDVLTIPRLSQLILILNPICVDESVPIPSEMRELVVCDVTSSFAESITSLDSVTQGRKGPIVDSTECDESIVENMFVQSWLPLCKQPGGVRAMTTDCVSSCSLLDLAMAASDLNKDQILDMSEVDVLIRALGRTDDAIIYKNDATCVVVRCNYNTPSPEFVLGMPLAAIVATQGTSLCMDCDFMQGINLDDWFPP